MTRTGIRLLSALLLLIMLPGAGAASAEAMPARDAWAIEKAKALATRMQVLAGDGQYIQLYMAQPAEGQDALLDALRAIPDSECSLELVNGLSPIVMNPCDGSGRYSYMVLPVRLKAGE